MIFWGHNKYKTDNKMDENGIGILNIHFILPYLIDGIRIIAVSK